MINLCQVELGITVVGDGEMSKPSYVSYVSQRLTGWVFHELVERVIYANGLGKCRQKMGEKNKTFVIKGVGSRVPLGSFHCYVSSLGGLSSMSSLKQLCPSIVHSCSLFSGYRAEWNKVWSRLSAHFQPFFGSQRAF